MKRKRTRLGRCIEFKIQKKAITNIKKNKIRKMIKQIRQIKCK